LNFLSADLDQVKAAHRVGARAIQIHPGRYCERGPDHEDVLRKIEDAVRLAVKLKLEVGVGHGID
jgi:pyridoxine 5-phosphate synthase